jgi:hypothetical protein
MVMAHHTNASQQAACQLNFHAVNKTAVSKQVIHAMLRSSVI